MNINLSLLGQMITFAIFVWFTMRYVWPPITTALEERKQNIVDGLASAEEGRRSLEKAKSETRELLTVAKQDAHQIVEDAKKRAAVIVDDAKNRAREEGDRLLAQAKVGINQEREIAKQSLYQEVAHLAVLGAERLLGKAVDSHANDELFKSLLNDIDVGKETWQS